MPLVEREPVASGDGWTMTVPVDQVDASPGGTERVLRSEKYNFKVGADAESEEVEKRRLEVKRQARRRCFDKFDPVKSEKAKEKRRKLACPAGLPSPAPPTAALAAAAPMLAAPVATGGVDALEPASNPPDLVTRRDWALLRAFHQLSDPAAVLEALRLTGLDDEEEPWSVFRVQERHEFLRRSVRAAARLVGATGGLDGMRELARLCM